MCVQGQGHYQEEKGRKLAIGKECSKICKAIGGVRLSFCRSTNRGNKPFLHTSGEIAIMICRESTSKWTGCFDMAAELFLEAGSEGPKKKSTPRRIEKEKEKERAAR